MLLQHAIDGIVGTFYNQVLFADFELEAHRLVEREQPVTSDALSAIYARLLDEYWGDALSPDARAKMTWARIPHFYQSPYYVYQYATCFASTAKLMLEMQSPDPSVRRRRRRSLPRRCSAPAAATTRCSCSRTPASISASPIPCVRCRRNWMIWSTKLEAELGVRTQQARAAARALAHRSDGRTVDQAVEPL